MGFVGKSEFDDYADLSLRKINGYIIIIPETPDLSDIFIEGLYRECCPLFDPEDQAQIIILTVQVLVVNEFDIFDILPFIVVIVHTKGGDHKPNDKK